MDYSDAQFYTSFHRMNGTKTGRTPIVLLLQKRPSLCSYPPSLHRHSKHSITPGRAFKQRTQHPTPRHFQTQLKLNMGEI